MVQEYQGPASFLHGLSDLWLRFFKDADKLKPLYRGTEILVGQAYLDLLSTVLNVSIRETPLFNREWFKLLTIREDHVAYDALTDSYVFELPDNIKNFEQMQNQIFSPTVLLEKELDFSVDTTGATDNLQLKKNLFDWTGSGDLIPGVGFRVVDVDGTDYREVALWLPEAQIDNFSLYLTYGYLVDRFEPSSESYRALLQGIMRYYMLGPTFDHIVTALNVIVGLPLVLADGEILQSVDRTTDNDYDLVITDQNTYTFAKGMPFRASVEEVSNWGTLVFSAFDYLSSVFAAKDNVSDPTWWYDLLIPQSMLPDESRVRRLLFPDLYDNLIDNPPGLVKIGDPGFFIGADDNGFVPSGRPSKRHLFSYIVFERFLKHNIYTIEIDKDALNAGLVPYPYSSEEVYGITIAGASAYLFLYIKPDLVLEDTALLLPAASGELSVSVGVPIENVIGGIDNALTIGLKSWNIGDYYKYGTTDITVLNQSVVPFTPNTVDTWVVIGGSDPSHKVQLVYDTDPIDSVTVIAHPAQTTWRIVTKTPTGGNKFDCSDVGRFVRIGADGEYHQILAVQDGLTLVTDGGSLGTGLRLTLWQHEGAEEGMGIVDWPVQVRVIP